MAGTIGNTQLFEYMMAGLPIICTDFRLWKQIVDKWKCGICVDLCNSDELVTALEYLRDNREEAEIMGSNGRIAVEKEYNWSTQEEELFDMYKALEASE